MCLKWYQLFHQWGKWEFAGNRKIYDFQEAKMPSSQDAISKKECKRCALVKYKTQTI